MNGETGFLPSFGAAVPEDPRGARHWGRIFVPQTHMRTIGVKRALHCLTETCSRCSSVSASALALSFPNPISTTYRCGPCGVVGDALASSKRSGKSIGFCSRVSPAVSDPWLEPIVDCGFDACRTSHSVAASERLTP